MQKYNSKTQPNLFNYSELSHYTPMTSHQFGGKNQPKNHGKSFNKNKRNSHTYRANHTNDNFGNR